MDPCPYGSLPLDPRLWVPASMGPCPWTPGYGWPQPQAHLQRKRGRGVPPPRQHSGVVVGQAQQRATGASWRLWLDVQACTHGRAVILGHQGEAQPLRHAGHQRALQRYSRYSQARLWGLHVQQDGLPGDVTAWGVKVRGPGCLGCRA